jgi:hypothetical protein
MSSGGGMPDVEVLDDLASRFFLSAADWDVE